MDALLAATSETVQAICERGAFTRVLLAVSDKGKPRLFMVSGCDLDGLSEPFKPTELEFWACSHMDSEAFAAGCNKGWTLSRMKRVNDTRLTTPAPALGGFCERIYYGGNLIRAEVNAKGVTCYEERVI